MTSEEAKAAVVEFGGLLQERFAYADANGFDYESALSALSAQIRTEVSTRELGYALHGLVARFVDGHAWVEPYRLAEGSLPVRIEALNERVVALRPDRSGFLAAGHPYLVSIDDRPITDWLKAVDEVIPVGSEAYSRRRRLLQLEHIQHWRVVMGLPLQPTVMLGVGGQQGVQMLQELVLPEPLPISRWPDRRSGILEGNVGYLRLPKMDAAAVEEVRQFMPELYDTRALIIDVRDNTGGQRTPLLELWSWLADDDEVTIGSVGAYRKWVGFDDDHLKARYMYRVTDPTLTDAQRRAVRGLAETFEPEADLYDERFSDWHYLILPQPQIVGPSKGRYRRPIVVLVNEKCFSAVDIFLGALKRLPNVTLMGRASSGGSAFGVRHDFANGAMATRLGSMISFTPDGETYDTNGFAPDVFHDPRPEDFVMGGGDSTLDAALAFLTPDHSKD